MSGTDFRRYPSEYVGELNLPAEITRQGSKQTYYTFCLLVPRQQRQDALRAYAYFRWLDDQLDCDHGTQSEKLELISRQRELMEARYRKEAYPVSCPEEQMLVELINHDHEDSSGLQHYLRNMMAVMSFDVQRRGRLITQAELSEYSRLLSTAVTELLFYFIGHDDPSVRNSDRYQAVRGAHIVHMLRDMLEDVDLGYINLPAETVKKRQMSKEYINSQAFRKWVLERVTLAHQCFRSGRKYFAGVKSWRCRLAAYAYLARFEWVLAAIEHDEYRLRWSYPQRKSLGAGGWMAWRIIKSLLKFPIPDDGNRPLPLPD